MFEPQAKPVAVPSQQAARPAPLQVPAVEPIVGEVLGSFTGFLRRPRSSSAGLLAQFFGENGPDADLISALHLTRFVETPVQVTVWMVKDRDGALMKGPPYPCLAKFIARIRRPSPSTAGMTALFFCPNGQHADTVSVLNKTSFLDALVHVELRAVDESLPVPALVDTVEPTAALITAAERLTPAEMRRLKETSKRAAEAQRLLNQHGFFRNDSVWLAIGNDVDLAEWMSKQPCCHPCQPACEGSPIQIYNIPGQGALRMAPLCREHNHVWTQGVPDLSGQHPTLFMESRRAQLNQRWAKERLRARLRVPADHDPAPSALYAWAVEVGLQSLLPPGFMALL